MGTERRGEPRRRGGTFLRPLKRQGRERSNLPISGLTSHAPDPRTSSLAHLIANAFAGEPMPPGALSGALTKKHS